MGWNTVIGEGSAEEPASDLLVDVSLAGTGEDESFVSDPLELWVTTKGGKTLARRTFMGMLVPNTGALHSPLWLPDVGCAGALTIHARFRKQTKTARLSLDCGE